MSATLMIPCLVCGNGLTLRTARGRKSGKPFLMLVCQVDGRHFRGFINDQDYVRQVLDRLEGHTPSLGTGVGPDTNSTPETRSKTIFERPYD